MKNKSVWRATSVTLVVAALLFVLAGSAYANLYGGYASAGATYAASGSIQTCPRTGCTASSCHAGQDPRSFYN